MEKRIDKIMQVSAYAWLLIPIVIFFAGFLKWYVAAACLLLLGVSVYFLGKDKENFRPSEGMKYSGRTVAVIVLGVVAWVMLSGIGGFGYQNWDLNFRNAIVHDLIDFDWPVYYDYSAQNIDHELYGQTGSPCLLFDLLSPCRLGWQTVRLARRKYFHVALVRYRCNAGGIFYVPLC